MKYQVTATCKEVYEIEADNELDADGQARDLLDDALNEIEDPTDFFTWTVEEVK